MRVIKFRGKSIDEGKWVYGDLLQFYLNGEPVKTNFYILPFEVEKIDEHTYENQPVSICYDTIGQFTGMYDKNGNEIYDGDIVKITGSNEAKHVTYSDKEAAFGIQYPDGGFFAFTFDISGISEYCYEVIGNIHDNPELLKGFIG